MGGFYYRQGDSQFPLTALQIARQPEGFDNPEKPEEDIQDKSKRDWFAKGIAILQFLQLILSLIVRKIQGFKSSQLEIMTLGFVVCGFLIYTIYLYKPQNVETSDEVKKLSDKAEKTSDEAEGTPDEAESTSDEAENGATGEAPIQFERTYDSFWDILTNERTVKDKTSITGKTVVDRIPNDNIPIVQNSLVHPGVLVLALASGLFGGLHCIAWNFYFPTSIEMIFWRTAAVTAALSPVVGLITVPLAQLTVSSGDPQEFMVDCLRLLREFSWQANDKHMVDEAYRQLEQKLIESKTPNRDNATASYKVIFGGDENQPPQLGKDLLDFIKSSEGLTEPPMNGLNNHFVEDFKSLCDLMENKGAKRLCDAAKTNVFPRKNRLPKRLNLVILSFTSGLYCLSRISLLALSLSCLRQMPESVYTNTSWTKYIPTLGSMG